MATELDPAGAELRAIHDAADLRNARVLEVGAGDGRLTFRYATKPKSVVGIDTKELKIKWASGTRRADLCPKVRFLCANPSALPFPARKFEIVLFACSL